MKSCTFFATSTDTFSMSVSESVVMHAMHTGYVASY